MKLGQVLEERYYAEDLFGLKKEVTSMILCSMVYPIFKNLITTFNCLSLEDIKLTKFYTDIPVTVYKLIYSYL